MKNCDKLTTMISDITNVDDEKTRNQLLIIGVISFITGLTIGLFLGNMGKGLKINMFSNNNIKDNGSNNGSSNG